MSALAKILAREPDPEADEIPGKTLSGIVAKPDVVAGISEQKSAGLGFAPANTHSPLSPPAQISSLDQALDACVAFLAKYMRVDSEHQPHVCALWAVACWVYQTFRLLPLPVRCVQP